MIAYDDTPLLFVRKLPLKFNSTWTDAFQNEIDTHNKHFGSWEQIKKFQLTPEEWTIDDGHLTPTMKLKRKVIKDKYDDLIESMYA